MLKNSPIVVFIFSSYFSIQHGRRLAWNRNHWTTFDAFKKSENRWIVWALLVQCFFIPFEITLTMKAENLDHRTVMLAGGFISLIFEIWPFLYYWWKNRNAN